MIHPCEIIEVVVHEAPYTFGGHKAVGDYKAIVIFEKESPDVIHITERDFIVQDHGKRFRTIIHITSSDSHPPQGNGKYFVAYTGDKLTEGKALVWLDKPPSR